MLAFKLKNKRKKTLLRFERHFSHHIKCIRDDVARACDIALTVNSFNEKLEGGSLLQQNKNLRRFFSFIFEGGKMLILQSL